MPEQVEKLSGFLLALLSEKLFPLIDRNYERRRLVARADACRCELPEFPGAADRDLPPFGVRVESRHGFATRRYLRPTASRLAATPVAPEMTACSGRITGRGRKCWSSRKRRGKRPARRNEDLPAPEAPRMTEYRFDAAFAHAPDRVETPHGRGLSAEEDGGVLELHRPQASVRCAIAIVLGRPREAGRIQSCAQQPHAQPQESVFGQRDDHLWHDGLLRHMKIASCEAGRQIAELPLRDHLGLQLVQRRRFE
jgi:hypothetical protein